MALSFIFKYVCVFCLTLEPMAAIIPADNQNGPSVRWKLRFQSCDLTLDDTFISIMNAGNGAAVARSVRR